MSHQTICLQIKNKENKDHVIVAKSIIPHLISQRSTSQLDSEYVIISSKKIDSYKYKYHFFVLSFFNAAII